MQRRLRGGSSAPAGPLVSLGPPQELMNTPGLQFALPAPAAGYLRLRFHPTSNIHRAAQELELTYKENMRQKNEAKRPRTSPPHLIASAWGSCPRPAFYTRAGGAEPPALSLALLQHGGQANAALRMRASGAFKNIRRRFGGVLRMDFFFFPSSY